jgi:hypothetical protein
MTYGIGILLAFLALAVIVIAWFGLPARPIALPSGNLVGALDDAATDPVRPELFGGGERRVVPFQIL